MEKSTIYRYIYPAASFIKNLNVSNVTLYTKKRKTHGTVSKKLARNKIRLCERNKSKRGKRGVHVVRVYKRRGLRRGIKIYSRGKKFTKKMAKTPY